MTIPATVIILTKNEERSIGRAIDSVSDFADVLVVDSASTDSTAEIAEERGARVLQFSWNGRYPKKKEWALEHAHHDWVVYLDADEYATPDVVAELARVVTHSSIDAADARISYRWLGKGLEHGHRVVKRIAIRRSSCHWPRPDDLDVPNMWEVEGHYQPATDGRVVSLRGQVVHDDRDPIRTWFDRHNRYSDWEAAIRHRNGPGAGRLTRTRQGELFQRVPFKPLAFFVYSYVLRLGFADGRAGFDYAFALATYYWQIGLKERELRRATTGRPA